MSECGITKDISFHCARHGFATLALSKGMPIESVSRVLGHTNIVTTQLYAKITTEKLVPDYYPCPSTTQKEKGLSPCVDGDKPL